MKKDYLGPNGVEKPEKLPDTPMGRIMGKWPGSETDEQIQSGLNSFSRKSVVQQFSTKDVLATSAKHAVNKSGFQVGRKIDGLTVVSVQAHAIGYGCWRVRCEFEDKVEALAQACCFVYYA